MGNENYELQVKRLGVIPKTEYWAQTYTFTNAAEAWEKYKAFKAGTARVVKVTREVLTPPVPKEVTVKFKVTPKKDGSDFHRLEWDSARGVGVWVTDSELQKIMDEERNERGN